MVIEVGQKLQGKISGITSFGAFVDLGSGKSGLVHISQISNGFVENIQDVVKVGDEVTVKVMSVGDDGKIGLSIRAALEQVVENKPKNKFPPKEKKVFERAPRQQQYNNTRQDKQDFDSLMSSFLKDSGDRLGSLRRNTEGKRGGRGGRRS